MGVTNSAQNSNGYKRSDAKWAHLFKRPVQTNLVVLKNKKWVRRGVSIGGPSYKGAPVLEKAVSDVIEEDRPLSAEAFRHSSAGAEFGGEGRNSLVPVDDSEVCMISDRLFPSWSSSFPSSFSFSDEGSFGSASLLRREVESSLSRGEAESGSLVQGGALLGSEGKLSSGGLCKGGVFRDCVAEGNQGCGSPRGLELVPFCGQVVEEEIGWDCQEGGDFVKQLGWVQDLVEDRLIENIGSNTPLNAREPERIWGEEDLLVNGMSQADVSKWVLKRINGFSKFLGVSFDGFEDKTMQLFTEIEEKWKNGASEEVKKGGTKVSKGVRELRRLQCSVNYEGRNKGRERGSEVVEGSNLLSFYEDQNS